MRTRTVREAMIAGAVLLLGAAACGQPLAAPRPPVTHHACHIRARSLLTSLDVYQATHSKFTHFLSALGNQPPEPASFGGLGPAYETKFQRARMDGFIINLALHGKYRRQNNALARRLRYPIRKWPLLPLEGPIARDHGGVLEVYYSELVWKAAKPARLYIRQAPASTGEPGYRMIRFRVPVGANASGDFLHRRHPVGPFTNPKFYENSIIAETRIGPQVFEVSIQGGGHIRMRTDLALLSLVVNRANKICPAQS